MGKPYKASNKRPLKFVPMADDPYKWPKVKPNELLESDLPAINNLLKHFLTNPPRIAAPVPEQWQQSDDRCERVCELRDGLTMSRRQAAHVSKWGVSPGLLLLDLERHDLGITALGVLSEQLRNGLLGELVVSAKENLPM
jgi:hypothetical protein